MIPTAITEMIAAELINFFMALKKEEDSAGHDSRYG